MAADGVRALARGLQLLRVFATRPAVSLTEAAAATGLPLPTALRALRTLEAAGFVERGEDGDYRPGLAVLELAPAVLASLRLPEAARPLVRQLAEETGETANLATLEGADVVYLVSHSGARLLTVNTPPGLRLPAHCTALGKALLAQLTPRGGARAPRRRPVRAARARDQDDLARPPAPRSRPRAGARACGLGRGAGGRPVFVRRAGIRSGRTALRAQRLRARLALVAAHTPTGPRARAGRPEPPRGMTFETLQLAESVRALVARHPTADPWRPGAHARDENPELERELLALGWDDLADPELLAFAAPAAVELGRGLAPLSLVDRLLGGPAAVDGLVRYADEDAVLVEPGTLRRLRPERLEPVGYTDAIGAAVVVGAEEDGVVEQASRDAWIAASAGYLAGPAPLRRLRLALEPRAARARRSARPLAAIDAIQQHLAGAATLADGALLLT